MLYVQYLYGLQTPKVKNGSLILKTVKGIMKMYFVGEKISEDYSFIGLGKVIRYMRF